MEFKAMLRLQKCLYLNVYLFSVWIIVEGFFLFQKFKFLDHFTEHLSIAVYVLLILIEIVRLYLGYYGNLYKIVPDLAGFLMLTVLMQLPLVTYFIFNKHLYSTPTELTLHVMICVASLAEIVFGVFSLRSASDFAKSVYLACKNT